MPNSETDPEAFTADDLNELIELYRRTNAAHDHFARVNDEMPAEVRADHGRLPSGAQGPA